MRTVRLKNRHKQHGGKFLVYFLQRDKHSRQRRHCGGGKPRSRTARHDIPVPCGALFAAEKRIYSPPQRRADKHARTVVAQRHSRKNVITDEAMTPTNVRSHLKVTMPRKIPIAVGIPPPLAEGAHFRITESKNASAASARKTAAAAKGRRKPRRKAQLRFC